MRYDSVYLTCSKKPTSRQHSSPHYALRQRPEADGPLFAGEGTVGTSGTSIEYADANF